MKKLIILSSALLGLCSSASAFVLNLNTLTGTLGTQVVNVAGYGNVTVSGLPAPGDLITSPFGLIMGAGDSLSITFSSGPVTNIVAVTSFGPVVGPAQTAANTYLFDNVAPATGQTVAIVNSITFDEDTSVPEPSSALLLTLGASSVLLRRRK